MNIAVETDLDDMHGWVERVRTALADWYARGHRPLPWRADRDPYRVLVSEMMLVQTTVAAVVPFFARFLARFPSVAALAEADEGEVLKLWEGLGYYRRARQLHAAARAIVREHGGQVPDDPDALRTPAGGGPVYCRRGALVRFRPSRADRRGEHSARAGAAPGLARRAGGETVAGSALAGRRAAGPRAGRRPV